MTDPFTKRTTPALDIGVAAFAAASVGFVTFAMPDDIFAHIIAISRLPDFLAAAQPPYGQTARFSVIAAASIVTFGLVFSLMRALDSIPSGRRPAPEAIEEEAPRLRRADAHPDAPARRPLLAGHELGEPLDEPTPWVDPEEPTAESESQPLPGFLVPEEPAETVEVVTAEPEIEAKAEPEPEAGPGVLELTEEEPKSVDILAARLPRTAEAEDEESVSKLMRRLEGGLSRRRRAPPVELSQEAPPTTPAEDRVGHRLRSAITQLQKISAQGG